MIGRITGLELMLGGRYIEYRNLDEECKKAVDIYFKREHENRMGVNYKSRFIRIDIPIQIIIDIIMSLDEYRCYGSFQNYHVHYMKGGDVVKHRKIWPIIISDGCDDLILDGWHRFHWYYEKGLTVIPCIAVYKF